MIKKIIYKSKTKVCLDCKKRKKIEKFGYTNPSLTKKNGLVQYLKSYCNECLQKRTKDWKAKNRIFYNTYYREYYKKNRKRIQSIRKQNYLADPEKFKRETREYYKKNKERIQKQRKQRNEKQKTKI